MTEMMIKLKSSERDALRREARKNNRHPRDQARQYICEALGLMTDSSCKNAGGTVSTRTTGIVTANQ